MVGQLAARAVAARPSRARNVNKQGQRGLMMKSKSISPTPGSLRVGALPNRTWPIIGQNRSSTPESVPVSSMRIEDRGRDGLDDKEQIAALRLIADALQVLHIGFDAALPLHAFGQHSMTDIERPIGNVKRVIERGVGRASELFLQAGLAAET